MLLFLSPSYSDMFQFTKRVTLLYQKCPSRLRLMIKSQRENTKNEIKARQTNDRFSKHQTLYLFCLLEFVVDLPEIIAVLLFTKWLSIHTDSLSDFNQVWRCEKTSTVAVLAEDRLCKSTCRTLALCSRYVDHAELIHFLILDDEKFLSS